MNSKSRIEFEKWAIKEGLYIDKLPMGSYGKSITDYSWKAWEAGCEWSGELIIQTLKTEGMVR
ncbi:hypothetical protein LCGC14_2635300 [marine sediment metagenome]|uniref:Uncharacterized protein n=1 Tax=marine sediment metagenome TaxID=412755 RepID=A0A0F8ZYY1_9ZZZZ